MSKIFDTPTTPLTQNASDAAVQLIRSAIVDGRLQPGERLREEELARELGISRTPVREALRTLQEEGLVESAPHRGATVRTYEIEDLDELYDMRALLEGHAARRAASRISATEIAKLRGSCDRFETLALTDADPREIVAENLLFHSTILDAAGSARLGEMVRKVIEMPLVYRAYIWYSQSQKRASEHAHRQLVNALACRDADRAELIMREHVYEGRDVLIAHLRAELEDDKSTDGGSG
jgi:DNA-binding GntR family transcriptional regulator